MNYNNNLIHHRLFSLSIHQQLYDESQRPSQNILAGVDTGADVGSSALMMKKSTVKLSDTLETLIPFDDTGEIAILFQDARSRGN